MALNTRLHLKQTERFIDERPVYIVVQRSKRRSDGRGGWVLDPPRSLPPQRVRKVGLGRLGATVERTTEDGSVVVPTSAIIGLPTVDIQRFDKFTIDGVLHQVVNTQVLPEWRIQAEVFEER